MVTETRPCSTLQETQRLTDVVDVGEHIDIPIVISPWWGSVRRYSRRVHTRCGKDWISNNWCSWCRDWVKPEEVKLVPLSHRQWVCPAGMYRYDIKWPEAIGDHVSMWAGKCGISWGKKGHTHSQVIEVVDYTDTAMLAKVSVKAHRLLFLIGKDEGIPFVTVVNGNVSTVTEAYDWMVPKVVFEAQMHGIDVIRQGDWWFVPRQFFTLLPVKEPKYERQFRTWPTDGTIPESGFFYKWGELFRSRHVAEKMYRTYPHDMVKGVVTAPDHSSIILDDWHYAIQNRQLQAINPKSNADDD